MSIKTGITAGTPSRIKFGAGVFFSGVTYDESVAPTESAIRTGILGATKDGGTVTITPEFYTPELDGALVAVKELQQKVGETATIETTLVELTPANVAKQVIGSVSETTAKDYDVITSSMLNTGHYYEGFGYYGELLDGRPVIVLFKNALCTSGLSMEGKNKEAAGTSATFECHSDVEYGVTNLPYAIFIRKEAGWQAATASEV